MEKNAVTEMYRNFRTHPDSCRCIFCSTGMWMQEEDGGEYGNRCDEPGAAKGGETE